MKESTSVTVVVVNIYQVSFFIHNCQTKNLIQQKFESLLFKFIVYFDLQNKVLVEKKNPLVIIV